jgi:hypothetical protein
LGENKGENNWFKFIRFNNTKTLILNAIKRVKRDEGSIPFTRSIQLQQLAQLCRKSAGELRVFQINFCLKMAGKICDQQRAKL